MLIDGSDNNKENVESLYSNGQLQSPSHPSPHPYEAAEVKPSEESRIQRTAQHEQEQESETEEQDSHQE